MKTINALFDPDDNQRPLTLAELEALAQFEACDQPGQVLFRPRVSSGKPTPDCLVFLEKICRFGLMFLTCQYSTQGGNWYRRESAEDVPAEVVNPLEEAWQRAMAAKTELRKELDIGAFFIPVVVFVDMEPDDDILNALRRRKVRVLWGIENLIERMIDRPDQDDLHPRLNSRFIEKEIEVLSPQALQAEPREEQMTLDFPDAGSLVMQHVETVNVHIAIVVPPAGENAPILRS